MQIVGMALLMVNKGGSDLGNYAASRVEVWQAGHEFVQDPSGLNLIVACILMALGGWVLFAPNRHTLIIVSIWFAANAWAKTETGIGLLNDLSLPGQALRFSAPLALVLMQRHRRSNGDKADPHRAPHRASASAVAILRIATASVFLAHGSEALMHHPGFQELIRASAAHAGFVLPTPTINLMLNGIGSMDIALALLLMTSRAQPVALWMANWALIAACSRVTAMGWSGHPETLLRMLNVGAPLALALLWQRQGGSVSSTWSSRA
jgi:uncharacterized membrane protein YphA (DoxX/SURF4 family)